MVCWYYYENKFDPCGFHKRVMKTPYLRSLVHTLRTANLHLEGYLCIAEFCMSISEWVRIIASGKLNLQNWITLPGWRRVFHYGTFGNISILCPWLNSFFKENFYSCYITTADLPLFPPPTPLSLPPPIHPPFPLPRR